MADSPFGLVAAAASKLAYVLFHGTRDRVNDSGHSAWHPPLCQAAPLCVVPTDPPSSTPRAREGGDKNPATRKDS